MRDHVIDEADEIGFAVVAQLVRRLGIDVIKPVCQIKTDALKALIHIAVGWQAIFPFDVIDQS